MKNLKVLFGLLVLVGLFASCGKDDTTVDQSPSLTFKSDAGYIYQDATVTVGDTFMIGVIGLSNEASKEKLEKLIITRTAENSTYFDTTIEINSDSFNGDFNFVASQAGSEKIEFTLVDKKDQQVKKSLNITTEANVNVVAYAAFQLGSWGEVQPSFYDAETGTAYSKSDAKEHQAEVDFAYYRGATTGNTIAATASEHVKTVYGLEAAGWTTFTNTVIAQADISAEDFDAIGDYYEWPEVSATSIEVNNLSIGDVLVFKTDDGKVGFVKVVDLTVTKDGEGIATLEVKVQK